MKTWRVREYAQSLRNSPKIYHFAGMCVSQIRHADVIAQVTSLTVTVDTYVDTVIRQEEATGEQPYWLQSGHWQTRTSIIK